MRLRRGLKRSRLFYFGQLDARVGDREDRFHQDGDAGGVVGKVQEKVGVFHFGAVIEDVNFDFRSVEGAGGNGDGDVARSQIGAGLVELAAVVDRAADFGGFAPVDAAKELQHAQGIAGAFEDAGGGGIGGGGFVKR